MHWTKVLCLATTSAEHVKLNAIVRRPISLQMWSLAAQLSLRWSQCDLAHSNRLLDLSFLFLRLELHLEPHPEHRSLAFDTRGTHHFFLEVGL